MNVHMSSVQQYVVALLRLLRRKIGKHSVNLMPMPLFAHIVIMQKPSEAFTQVGEHSVQLMLMHWFPQGPEIEAHET